MKSYIPIVFFAGLLLTMSCNSHSYEDQADKNVTEGKLIIFHAGSLSLPLKEVAEGFNKEYPGLKLEMEAAGSLTCVRKITDLHRDCDIILSADYKVIDQLLIPEYADWNIHFATNEMVIAFAPDSKFADEISSYNWFDILLRNDVSFGRSDPDSDPCGYRAIMMLLLAEKCYLRKRIYSSLTKKDRQFIRPKSADLIALLEVHAIDYLFGYKSVAVQHGLEYISLPDEINLANSAFEDHYAEAKVAVAGIKPGDSIIMKGETISYGLCMIKQSKNPENAYAFLEYLLDKDKGMKIMEENGQQGLMPHATGNYNNIPERLRKLLYQIN